MLTSSKYCHFRPFSDVIGPHTQVKRHVAYIYSKGAFYWLSYHFYKTQKNVFAFEK